MSDPITLDMITAVKRGIHPDTFRALEEIDASFFSGDSFHSAEALAFVQAYLDRWSREAESIRRMLAVESEAPEGPQEPELLPCPFCGCEPSIQEWKDEALWDHSIVPYYRVRCSGCEILGPDLCDDREGVITHWNTRHM